MVAFSANTNILSLTGLYDAVSEAFINDADVAVTTIETEDGEAVFPLSGYPITMDYVSGSDGNYRAVLDHTLPLTPGVCYVAHIDADAGDDRVGHWEFKFIPLRRTTK